MVDAGRDGVPTWPSALAAWLSEIPDAAPLHSPPTAAVLEAWLSTVRSIALRPHTCTYHLLPVFRAMPNLLDTLAASLGFSRSGTSSTSGTGVAESVLGSLQQIAALIAGAPLAAAAVLDDPRLTPRASALLVSYLTHELAAAAAKLVAPRPPHPTGADEHSRRRAAVAAAAALRAMAALARAPALQRALVAAGVDAVLVQALLCAPRCRCGSDDDALLSWSTMTVVRLIRARMRWPDAAALAAAAGSAVSLEEPRSALVAALKALHRGSDSRCCHTLLSQMWYHDTCPGVSIIPARRPAFSNLDALTSGQLYVRTAHSRSAHCRPRQRPAGSGAIRTFAADITICQVEGQAEATPTRRTLAVTASAAVVSCRLLHTTHVRPASHADIRAASLWHRHSCTPTPVEPPLCGWPSAPAAWAAHCT